VFVEQEQFVNNDVVYQQNENEFFGDNTYQEQQVQQEQYVDNNYNYEDLQQEPQQQNFDGVMDYTDFSYQQIFGMNLPVGTTIRVKYNFVKDVKTLSNAPQQWKGDSKSYNSSNYTIEVTRVA
jgi:hypothetical protein